VNHESRLDASGFFNSLLKRMLSTPHLANPKREPTGIGAKRGRPPKPDKPARKPKAAKGRT
jgi:hypothetical protein